MGRRYTPLHEALVAYCGTRGLTYRYRPDGEYLSPDELGRLAGRARYFVVTPPDLNDAARTGGFSPLVMRYLEGLSAGARLLGVLPKSGEYQDLLPRAAILEVAPDGSDLEARLDADAGYREGWAAVEQARILVRSHHSWERRAEQIRGRLACGATVDLHRTGPVLPPAPLPAGASDEAAAAAGEPGCDPESGVAATNFQGVVMTPTCRTASDFDHIILGGPVFRL
jgi:hypothetical protein